MPLHSILYDVIPVKYHGSATGIMLFIGFILGSFAPWILGLVKPHLGLSCGLAMLSAVWIFFAIALYINYKFYYARDCARAMAIDAETV